MADRLKRRKLGNRHWRESHGDGVIKTEQVFQPSEDTLYVETTQPGKRAILENNQRLAQLSDRHTKLTAGVRIPEIDMAGAVERYPLLFKGTQEERSRELRRVIRERPEWVIIRPNRKLFSVGAA